MSPPGEILGGGWGLMCGVCVQTVSHRSAAFALITEASGACACGMGEILIILECVLL
jgi:hypothetical protein